MGNTINRYSDSAGRLVWLNDALGQSTVFTQDALDRITGVTDPNNGPSSFAYDANGNLLSVTDANSNQTSRSPTSSRNRRIRQTGGILGEAITMTLTGDLTAHLDQHGDVTALQYETPSNRIKFAGFRESVDTLAYESTIAHF